MEWEGFSAKEKELMLLARETRIGITITGMHVFVLTLGNYNFYFQ